MKATDVTNEMVAGTCEAVGSFAWDGINRSEIIAAAVNAVLGDPTPITAELLVKNGWGRNGNTYERRVPGGQYICWDGFGVLIDDIDDGISKLPTIQTIGQLRALEIGLGIEPCQ